MVVADWVGGLTLHRIRGGVWENWMNSDGHC